MSHRRGQQGKVQRPHWIVFVVAILGLFHIIYGCLIAERHGELDGNHYWLLTPAADLLDQRYPLAATLMLRAMVDFALDKARSKRYGHAARHLQSCEYLSKRIDDWAGHPDHAAYLANLKLRHGRKAAFWDA